MQDDLHEDKKQSSISSDYKIPLLPNPIEDISTQFPPSIAKLQDFFHVHELNERNAEIQLAFTMPGTIEDAPHVSMKNTLK